MEKPGIQSITVSGKIPLNSFLCDAHQGLTSSSTIPAVSRLAPPPPPTPCCEWAEAWAEIPARIIHLRAVTPAATPCPGYLCDDDSSPVHNGVTLPAGELYLLPWTGCSALLTVMYGRWLLRWCTDKRCSKSISEVLVQSHEVVQNAIRKELWEGTSSR